MEFAFTNQIKLDSMEALHVSCVASITVPATGYRMLHQPEQALTFVLALFLSGFPSASVPWAYQRSLSILDTSPSMRLGHMLLFLDLTKSISIKYIFLMG